MYSWAQANDYLRACCIADLDRRLLGREMTVGEALVMERGFLRPLPAEPFELSQVSEPRVDAHARVRVATNMYSVPVRTISCRRTSPEETIFLSASRTISCRAPPTMPFHAYSYPPCNEPGS